MELSSPIPFAKMHGSGNDFVVIQLPHPGLQPGDLAAFAQKVCRKGTGIGADGVIVIRPSEVADFHWHYINADGSDGDMCGNGAMVGARYAVEHGLASAECSFSTAAGVVRAVVDGENVTLEMVDAQITGDQLRFTALPEVDFDAFTVGVPHVVGFVACADALDDLDEIGRAIRNDAQLQPAGANVNIVHRLSDHSIRMRTYERGVEAETLACGTGAVCSAVAASWRGMVQQPVAVHVSSGMELTVTWQEHGNLISDIRLGGTARMVAFGEITPEAVM